MQLTFIKNIQFTKLIKADGRLREFNFRRYNCFDTTNNKTIYIDVYLALEFP